MMRTITDLRLEELTSRNSAMRRCLQLASFAAKSDAPVLILGRTGTGKTLLAHAIHNSSARANGPFVSFNASAMSDTLLESELFGHERGAFTGAMHVHRGKFETAHTGTLFLDEIADMSPLAQAKILRAVEYGEFERVGGERLHRSNVRIISATNCSLRERIAVGKFREDLYHRLDGLVLLIPPLCERQEDLPSLIAMELEAAAAEIGKRITSIHPAAMEMLLNHAWPGNLRELRNAIERALILWPAQVLEPAAFPERIVGKSELGPRLGGDSTVDEIEREHIERVIERTPNLEDAARILGIDSSTLWRKRKKYGR